MKTHSVERRAAMAFDENTGIAKRIKLVKTPLARTLGTDSAAYRRIVGLEM